MCDRGKNSLGGNEMKFIKKIWDKIRPKNAFDLLFFTMLCLIFNIIVLMYKLLK